MHYAILCLHVNYGSIMHVMYCDALLILDIPASAMCYSHTCCLLVILMHCGSFC